MIENLAERCFGPDSSQGTHSVKGCHRVAAHAARFSCSARGAAPVLTRHGSTMVTATFKLVPVCFGTVIGAGRASASRRH